MSQEPNQAANKRTLWRTGVVAHPDYRVPTSPKSPADPEKKPLFPMKIRPSRNFTLSRKKSPNSNPASSPGIQLQSFSKLQISSEAGSLDKGRSTSTSACHSSQGSLNLSKSKSEKCGTGNREEKKKHFSIRPRSCAADIDISLTTKRREFAERSSWKKLDLDNSAEDAQKGSDDEREREASLDLIRESLTAVSDPMGRQLSDEPVFEEDQDLNDKVPGEVGNQTSFERASNYPSSATLAHIGSDVSGAEAGSMAAAGSDTEKPAMRLRAGRITAGSRAVSAVYDSLPSSPLFNPGETWRYRDASTQCQEEEVAVAPSHSGTEKKSELRRRKYGRAFRQKRAATIGGNIEQTTGERRRKTLAFSRSQSECAGEMGTNVPHSCSFRHFREKKRNYLPFPDYLIASMALLPDYASIMENQLRSVQIYCDLF